MKRPCLDCGTPTTATRCDGCATKTRAATQPSARRNRGPRRQYAGDYRRRAEGIRGLGYCWICGQPGSLDDPIQADHLLPAAINPNPNGAEGGLAPAHRSCNIRRAAALRVARRRAAEKADLDRRLHRE